MISPFASRIFSINFGLFSVDVPFVLDLVNPAARVDMKALVIPIPTSMTMLPTILPSVVTALGPNVEVDAVWIVHHRASPIVVIWEFGAECSAESKRNAEIVRIRKKIMNICNTMWPLRILDLSSIERDSLIKYNIANSRNITPTVMNPS